jgi:hypothetical protein
MKKSLSCVLFSCIVYLYGCHSTTHTPDADNAGDIPEFRKEVKKEPVAGYKEKINDPLNNWYFSVQLFETPQTFKYLIKMQYEEVRGEDTLKLPDFGLEPQPVLQKGNDKYSCIIGFMDRDKKFREYKLVSVSGNELKLTTLNHYSVVETSQTPAP